jgi:hypothetical protein
MSAAFRFAALDFVLPTSLSPGTKHAFSVCELAHSGTHSVGVASTSSGNAAGNKSTKRRAQPGQLLVLANDSLTCVAASANLIERDADRRIGPAPPPCPPTHLNACATTLFPIASALRTTRGASDWQLLAVDSFLQARDDQGVAQFTAIDTPPSVDGLRRGPIIVYAVRVFHRDSSGSASASAATAAATSNAPVANAATNSSNAAAAATTATTAATATSSSSSSSSSSATAANASTAATGGAQASAASGAAPTLASEKNAPSLTAMATATATSSSSQLSSQQLATNLTAPAATRHILIVHGARSRIDEPVSNLSGDWEQIDIGFVPVGIAHVELPRAGGANLAADAVAPEAASDADDAATSSAAATSAAAGTGEQDNDSDTASQRSRGSTASSQRRRRPGSVATATTTGTSGSIGASSGSNGRRCAIIVLGGDGLIHCFAQTETGMRFVEFTTGVWWIAALRSAGQLTQRGRESVLSPLGAASTPIVSTTNTNAPTTPVVSRPSSPRLGGHFNPLESLLIKAVGEKDFFALPSTPSLPASGGVPLCIDTVETHDADQYAFAVGFHSGLVRMLLAPTVDIEAEFGDGDGGASGGADEAEQLRFMHWFDGPIAAVRLFRDRTSVADGALAPVHLLVVGALGYAVTFDNVLRDGLTKPRFLPQSDNFDALLCCEALDCNQDGYNELLIGTFSGHILVYARGGEQQQQDGTGEWRLVDDRVYASAVHSIVPINLLGGGESAQLAVSTADGLQLLVNA